MLCANLIHIAPWPCCAALMQGAARHLAPTGLLITYGPYLEDGVPTARRQPWPSTPTCGHDVRLGPAPS
jgi:hypothetical protein